ncbi:MAG: M55 family metallopeptidase [Kiritimatiellae bacterium]|nr:M55 family metallopeptidase [Kiritimatiellia bacterium]
MSAVDIRVWTLLMAAACVVEPCGAFQVYVFADMEGCTGVTGSEFIHGARAGEGVAAMEGDINACVAACFEAGATVVIVRDGHGGGSNVTPSRVDGRARLIQGPTRRERYPELAGSEAVILLGYHAMSLTPGAVLAHTYSSKGIQRMRLNGREVGEIGVDAAIAAEYGVPVVLVTGDDKTCAEARAWIPGVVVCETKRGTGPQSAEPLPAEVSRRRIREATIEALRKRREIPLIRIEYPATLTRELLPPGSRRTHDPAFVPVPNPQVEERTGERVETLLLGPAG